MLFCLLDVHFVPKPNFLRMRILNILALLLFVVVSGNTQNPATTFTIANRLINLPCGTGCTSISAQVPHIKQSNSYVVTNPAYAPFSYVTATGIDVRTLISGSFYDDQWTSKVPITFPFCYYGVSYPTLLIGTNSAVTFDTSRASTGSGFTISSTTGAIPNTAYAPSMIFGPYHDIDIDQPGGTNKRIEYRIEGVAPKRRFIVSYNAVPYFGSSCAAYFATHQMVLYEATGIVEVYIKDKPFCTGWNSGLTILGMQNQARNAAITASGKNATRWGTNGMDSCWRFIPSGGASQLKSARLLLNGSPVANADTSTSAPGVLNLNFPNVCPLADSSAYVIEVKYGDCNNPANDVVFTDTVIVKKSAPGVTINKVDPNCQPNGSITLTATGGNPPYQYSIDGGVTYQSSNTFSGLAGGTYTIKVKDALNCTSTQTVVLTAANPLIQNISKTDAACATPGTITVNASGGGVPPYEFSIDGGITYQSSNTFSGLAGGTYSVKTRNPATGCTVTNTVVILFTNNLTMNAITGGSICSGASFSPSVTSNANAYAWSPVTGVSNAAIPNPTLSPTVTTTYTLTGTLGVCSTQQSVTVVVFSGAVANAGSDAIVIAGDRYQLQATASAGSYLWSPSTGLSDATILNPVATPSATTTYRLRVTTSQGCVATDDMTLTVVPYCIKPMRAFTPNGDGINDKWLITDGSCLSSARAQVFNRYGAKVFESSDYRNTWDGTYKGKPLPDGTYYFIITYQLINSRVETLKGNLTILR
jgi:gliding motility-associated-like protein